MQQVRERRIGPGLVLCRAIRRLEVLERVERVERVESCPSELWWRRQQLRLPRSYLWLLRGRRHDHIIRPQARQEIRHHALLGAIHRRRPLERLALVSALLPLRHLPFQLEMHLDPPPLCPRPRRRTLPCWPRVEDVPCDRAQARPARGGLERGGPVRGGTRLARGLVEQGGERGHVGQRRRLPRIRRCEERTTSQ